MQKLTLKTVNGYKQTEIGVIPLDWEVVRLGDICDVRDGTHDSPKYQKNGIPFITSKHLTDNGIDFSNVNYISNDEHINFTKRSLVENGDILFGMIGTIGKPLIVNYNFEFSIKNIALLKFKNNKKLDNFFTLNLLKSVIIDKQFTKLSNGGVQSFIALGMIRSLKIPLPLLEEQQKIAKILSTTDNKIEAITKKIEKAEIVKTGLMQRLLYNESWEIVKLGDIATFYKGKGISKNDISETGIECIRYGELYTKYNEQIKDIFSKTNILKDKLFFSKKNDILIPSSGETAIDLATASCVQKEGIALGGDINVIRTELNGIFFAYYLNTILKHKIASLAQGSSVIHLYASHLRNLKISYPPLKEQQKTANILSKADQKIEILKVKKEQYKTLKIGLMQKLLTGKVRV